MIDAEYTTHRWPSRKEENGCATLNHPMRDGRIHEKKLDSKKVCVDLNSIDALPRVGAAR